jgi:tetratricopeptide (TPR) repeat protein
MAHYALGRISLTEGKHEEAVSHLTSARSVCPDHADLHYCLGRAYVKKSQPVEAEKALKAAVSINRNFVSARLELALLLQRLSRFDEAREHFLHVLGLEPDNPLARSYLDDQTPQRVAPSDVTTPV